VVSSVHRGNAAGRTPDEVKAILREHFGQPTKPQLNPEVSDG
jgi:hypothetical protein